MKFPQFILGLILLAGRCWAIAPDSPVGLVYYESGRNLARVAVVMAIVLNGDGRYQVQFVLGSGTGAQVPPYIVLNPESGNGTWSYQKTDSDTATLAVKSDSGSGGAISGVRSLRFSTDTTGIALRNDILTGGLSGGPIRLVNRASRSPLSNCSNRSVVESGGSAFAGFVVTDSAPRAVLIRAIGPSLGQFGIADFLKTPQLSVVAASDNSIVANVGGWWSNVGKPNDGSVAISRTSAFVGAFPLLAGSNDAATIVYLSAGAYIAQATSADANDTGQVLVEVYMLP